LELREVILFDGRSLEVEEGGAPPGYERDIHDPSDNPSSLAQILKPCYDVNHHLSHLIVYIDPSSLTKIEPLV